MREVNCMDLNKLKYLVIDVDGTMTDSGIYYDENGNELKRFSTKDAAGFFAADAVGIKVIVLTGRKCEATSRRMKEMKVKYIFQKVDNKFEFLCDFMTSEKIHKEEIGYIGDDLNDLAPMKLVGFVGCPLDSCQEVKEIAHYISPVLGGYGAVRDVIEHILRKIGKWEDVIKDLYNTGV